ncbi:MAG TPA: phosphodiester glycosidase family protein, partial [Oceanobacillus sp.]|nr:phosphodiester glycosidase family protein [Oceanobacillus sp.]
SLLSGCMLSQNFPPTATTIQPTVDTSPAEEVWETLAPGLERRVYRPGGEYTLTQFVVLRIDPALYTFRAHYRPGQPLSLQGWRENLPDAVAFVNANFFDPQNNALGLLVADGVVYGQAFPGYGGMLQVQNGQVRVRSNIVEPYVGEPLEQAVQAFPVLVTNGQASYANTQGDRISRRTVVGQDSTGRIILMVTASFVGMRLVDLSNYLPTTDLDLVTAVNLDGGGSTMMAINVPSPFQVLSFDAVPAVLAVYAR